MTQLQGQWQDASYWTGKDDACNRPTSKLQNTGLLTQNSLLPKGLFQRTSTFSSDNILKHKQAREQSTHVMWVGKISPVPKFFIKLKKCSCSWHPLTFLLSFLTQCISLFLPGRVPSSLIHTALASSFRLFSPQVPCDPDLSHPCRFISSSRWELPGHRSPIANHVTVKYLSGSKEQLINYRLIILRIKSWSPSLVGVTENNARSL